MSHCGSDLNRAISATAERAVSPPTKGHYGGRGRKATPQDRDRPGKSWPCCDLVTMIYPTYRSCRSLCPPAACHPHLLRDARVHPKTVLEADAGESHWR